jgi:hypothetical protein
MARSQGQVTDLLKAASEAVKDAGVAKELQPLAFERALDLLAGKAPPAPSGDGAGSGDGQEERELPPPDTSTKSGKVADVFGITADEVDEIMAIDESDLHLTVPRERFAENRADAVREVGLVIVAARQAAGLDEDRTHTKFVRRACEDLGLVNKNTFQAEMAALASANFVSSKNVPSGKELKLISQGRSEIKSLAPTLLGRS